MPSDERPYRYYLMLIVAMAFWGGSWVSAKIVVGVAPPMTIGFFRFLIGGIMFIFLMLAIEPDPWRIFRRENLLMLFLVGLTGIFGYGVLFLTGMRFTTAAQGSIIAGFNPTTVSIVAHIMHGERLSRKWQYLGYAFAFSGVIFVVGIQSILDFNIEYLIGNVIILAAMMTWGLYSSIGKEAMKKLTPLQVNAGGALFGTILFGIGAAYEEVWTLPALADPVFWVNAIYLGACVTFVGFLFYFISIKKIGASRAGGFINLVPVFGIVSSAMILPDEPIFWTFGIGLVLVLFGISLINFPIREKHHMDESQKS